MIALLLILSFLNHPSPLVQPFSINDNLLSSSIICRLNQRHTPFISNHRNSRITELNVLKSFKGEKKKNEIKHDTHRNEINTTINSFLEENSKLLQEITHIGNITTSAVTDRSNLLQKLTRKEDLNENDIRELNASITYFTSKDMALQDVEIIASSLPTSSYTPSSETKDQKRKLFKIFKKETPSQNNRLNQDILHLSSSIASTIDTLDQWILFVNDYGNGFTPLFLCIHEAATVIRNSKSKIVEDKEEIFLAACRATRSLRNLCSLNPNLAAVVTDSILHSDEVIRYNLDEYDNVTIVQDLIDLLHYWKENESLVSKALIEEKGLHIWRRQAKLLESRRRFQLYIIQLLLSMAVSSDQAIWTFRSMPDFLDTIVSCSSYAPLQRIKEKLLFSRFRRRVSKRHYFSSVDSIRNVKELDGMVKPANQLLAALGYNVWLPKTPGQRGLRILCLDGGGTRGVTAITTLRSIVDAMGGKEVCDTFDMIVGTSTGAIIAFLVGLKRESSRMAKKRYDTLIRRIFVKSALSTPMLVFTTASYDEGPFMEIMTEILGSASMIDSRCDPTVPYLFGVSSKMSSIPTGLCLFRNYNYNGGERPDKFVIDPMEARSKLGLEIDYDASAVSKIPPKAMNVHHLFNTKKKPLSTVEGSRHPGSFRVSQSIALRASTAAPTFFKPVLMRGELYCDGGIVTSNPAAVAIHEARILFPDIPIELLVSCGTGDFIEVQNEPKIGWDAIISQIVNSATDGEKTHHILEDILGQADENQKHQFSNTKYFRFNPVIGLPDAFPIDTTDMDKLQELSEITANYLKEEEQVQKLNEIRDILNGKRDSWWRKLQFWR